jgi:hypothetical protein
MNEINSLAIEIMDNYPEWLIAITGIAACAAGWLTAAAAWKATGGKND